MPPRVDGTSATSSSYDGSPASDDNSTTVQLGESSLSQVAARFHLNPDDLLLANPQITDPYKLKVGQEIHLPQNHSASSSSSDTQPEGPHFADYPKQPSSDPIADAFFKAKLANMDGTERQSPATNRSINFSNLPEFKALPPGVQKQLLDAAKDPAVEMRLQQVLQRPLYSQLTTEQRTELLNVFAGANDEGRQELVQLMGRRLPDGDSALLSKDNSPNHATLLDNLNNLANQPLNSSVAGRRSEILSQVIEDAAEPTWYMDQGPAGTCAPTSHQTNLLLNSPSEYARLIGGLFGPDRAATLANGDKMYPALNDLAPNPIVTPSGQPSQRDTRSITERVFQSALAQYAYVHSGRTPPIVNASADIPGLDRDASAIALSGLYGRSYHALNNGPLAFPQVVNDLDRHHGPVPVSLNWGGGGHMVIVDHVDKDKAGNVTKVYIRNPWGSAAARGQNYRDGQTLGTTANNSNAGPPRTVADAQSGLEVMTAADFVNNLKGAVVRKID